ncbi:hypothetical protein Y032_0315g2258 [Ancylostoma ceylanicum]|nr:hypothetical protein Y032_0315g2258 [Ancylostoma ceylanicum]
MPTFVSPDVQCSPMRDLVPFLSLAFLAVGDAHVALTFPEARYPPLDFLDTSRTSGPCGVPVPRRPHYTNLLVGSTYNFTWRMQYPHQGGYRIVLIDKDGKTIEELAPINGIEFAGADDQTSQSQNVRLTRPCSQCTVMFERQALEWGKSYRFRSCADVNVLETMPEDDKCSGHGTMVDNRCVCEHGHKGDICQYTTNCHHDDDCLNGGKCLAEPNSITTASCYCSYGFFGKNCEQTYERAEDNCFSYATINEKKYEMYGMFDSACYNKDKLNDNDVIYYRKVKNDVEIILDFSTASWVSIGWRPEGLDKSCRLFPDLEGVRSKRSATVDMPPLVVPPPSQPIRRDPPPTPSDPHDQEQVFDRDHPPAKIAQEGPRPVMPRNNGLLDAALRAPLHAMDCVDVLIGAIRDGRTRVQDSYSRDRSTPLEDSWYDGEMSLVASAGREIDGRTVVMFRRPIQEIEPTDHPLGPGRMFVVWAKGQQQGAYTHGAPSALDGPNSSTHFYPDDIIKYHGAKNRGVHPIDFTTPVKMLRPGDAAFGVNIAATPSAQLPTHHDTAKHPAITTPSSSSSPPTSTKSTSHISYREDSSSTRDSTILFVLVTAFIALY